MLLRNAATVVLLSALLGGCSMQPLQETSQVARQDALSQQQKQQKQKQQNSPRTVAKKAESKTSNSFFPFSFFDRTQAEDEDVVARDDEQEPDEYDVVFDFNSNSPDVKDALYSQLKEWRSVRYKLGGMSKKGIDCSGFVFLTYRDKFGVELPRNTTYQALEGDEITQRELKPGDLVFFQVNRRTRHVGIYVEGRKFIHASSKKGVTVSSLDNSYWSKRYWKAVRVDTPPSMM